MLELTRIIILSPLIYFYMNTGLQDNDNLNNIIESDYNLRISVALEHLTIFENEIKANNINNANKQIRKAYEIIYNIPINKYNSSANDAMIKIGNSAYKIKNYLIAYGARKHVLSYLEKTLPVKDIGLQKAKTDLSYVLRELGNFDGAKKLQLQVLEIYEHNWPSDHDNVLKAKLILGEILYKLKDYEASVKLQKQVIKDYVNNKPDNYHLLLICREQLAWTLMRIGDYNNAKKQMKITLNIYMRDRGPDDNNVKRTQKTLSTIENKRVNQLIDVKILKKLEKQYALDSFALQTARLNISFVLREKGEIRAAAKYEKKALLELMKICSSKNIKVRPFHLQELQRARLNYAWSTKQLGNLEEALNLEREALKDCKSIYKEGHHELQRARRHLAVTLKELGHLIEAKEIEEKVLEVYAQLPYYSSPEQRQIQINYAWTLFKLGKYFKARKLIEEVLDIYKKELKPDDLELQRARVAYSGVLHVFGDFYNALQIEKDVLSIYDKKLQEEDIRYPRLVSNLGTTLYYLHDYKGAFEHFNRAYKIQSKYMPDDHHELILTKNNISNALHQLGDLNKAKIIRQEVVKACERKRLHFMLQSAKVNLATSYMSLGKTNKALSLLNEVYNQRLVSYTPDNTYLQRTKLLISEIYLRQGKFKQAEKLTKDALKGALDFISAMMRLGSVREVEEAVKSSRWTLNRYLTLFIKDAYEKNECFIITDRFKASGARAMSYAKKLMMNKELSALKDKLTQANLMIQRMKDSDLAEAVRERDKVERDIKKHIGINGYIDQVTVENISSSLPKNTFGVSYIQYSTSLDEKKQNIEADMRYLAFVINKEATIEWYDLGPSKIINDTVTSWLNYLSTYKKNKIDETGQLLTSLIWAPLNINTKDTKNIIISPDSAIAAIPVECLPFKNKRLLDFHNITYIDALASLAHKPGPIKSKGNCFVAFGGVDYDNMPCLAKQLLSEISENDLKKESKPPNNIKSKNLLTNLSGAKEEVMILAKLFEDIYDSKAILVTGSSASKQSLIKLAPLSTYLHIATHGFFSNQGIKDNISFDNSIIRLAPSLLSGLYLAGGNLANLESKCIITAEEIQGLDLTGCELAVLSACETNVGLIRSGPGVLSMQRALGIAGARNSITSLWKVDDDATKTLFVEFYRRLWEENISPAEALHKVKLDMRNGEIGLRNRAKALRAYGKPKKESDAVKDYSHPYYWAAFVCYGSLAQK